MSSEVHWPTLTTHKIVKRNFKKNLKDFHRHIQWALSCRVTHVWFWCVGKKLRWNIFRRKFFLPSECVTSTHHLNLRTFLIEHAHSDPLTHCDGGKFSFKVIPTLKPPIPPLLSHYLSKKRKNATFPALLWEKRAINHSWHEWHTMSHMSEPMALQYSIHSITWLQSMGGAKNSPFHLAMTQIVCDADAICVG